MSETIILIYDAQIQHKELKYRHIEVEYSFKYLMINQTCFIATIPLDSKALAAYCEKDRNYANTGKTQTSD